MNAPLFTPKPDRINMRYLFNELLLLANLEKGLGYTIKQWLIYPGRAAQEFLYENRHRMMKPFPLLALTVAAATFVSLQVLPLGESLWEEVRKDLPAGLLSEEMTIVLRDLLIGMKKYFNLFYTLSLPGQALASYIVFQKRDYNLAEHLVINTYIFCVQTFLYLITLPLIAGNELWAGGIFLIAMFTFWIFAVWRIFGYPFRATLWRFAALFLLMQIINQFILSLGIGLYYAYLTVA